MYYPSWGQKEAIPPNPSSGKELQTAERAGGVFMRLKKISDRHSFGCVEFPWDICFDLPPV